VTPRQHNLARITISPYNDLCLNLQTTSAHGENSVMSIRQHSLLNILALARSNSQILPSLKMQSDSVFLRNLLPPLLRALLLASCLFTAPAIALSLFGGNTSSDELLPPEQAFRAAVTTASDGGQLHVI